MILYLIILLGIGFWASKKSDQNGGDLFLAGKAVKMVQHRNVDLGDQCGAFYAERYTSLAYSAWLVGGNFIGCQFQFY